MPTFHIEQFGCRATHADGAAIERQLLDRGCHLAGSADTAEIVVLNTCTVTSAADSQARDTIRKIHAANPATKIIVTGCYAQRAPEEIAALAGVTCVVGNSHKPRIPDLISPGASQGHALLPNFVSLESLGGPAAQILTGDIFETTEVLVAAVLGGEGNHTRPTLKIQDGCSNRCAFCVIPFVRGRSRSLPPATVVEEIRRLAISGHKEIVLSGINLGAWGRDLSPRHEFLDLLRQILDESPVKRLRLSSIEPLDVTKDLVALFASTPRLAEHFHMPLQSASDRILAAMHRWYRSEHYSRRIEFIREQLPHAAIGADVITGFPGETEADHYATMEFIESRPFTYLHVFSYSSRPGTRAASLPNPVTRYVIKRRARELRALCEQKSREFRRLQCGRILSAITLRHSDAAKSKQWTPALTSNFLKLRLAGEYTPNSFVNVECGQSAHDILLPKLQMTGAAIA